MSTAHVAELMNALIAQGNGNLDHSALAFLLDQMGAEIRVACCSLLVGLFEI
jgi:hypothetical protein